MTDQELMQQALDALELLARYENPSTKVQVRKPRDGGPIVTMYPHKVATEAAVPLRARLAQPEQEPVAVDSDKVICPSCCHQFRAIPVNVQQLMIDAGFRPPFTAPPQREWQSLTDEEIEDACWTEVDQRLRSFARAIEAKLKEKNHG